FLAGWGLIISMAVVVVWLTLAGMTVIGALAATLVLLMMFLVISRVVAETGLIFVQIFVSPNRTWVYMLNEVPHAMSVRTTTHNYFFNKMLDRLFIHDMREALAPYAINALRTA